MKRVIFAEHFMYRLSLRCQSSKSTEFTLNWHGFHFFPFLALKIWALVVLKFFDVVLKFELPNARVLNFPKISASSLMWSACHKKSYLTNLEVRNLKSEISCLCPVWLSQFCLFWKKMGKGFVNIPKFVNSTHNK